VRMGLFRAIKTKKMGDKVLQQVAPYISMVTRFGGGITPSGLAKDRYVLGFICGNIGLEMQRAGSASLDHVAKGNVVFLVLAQLFGRENLNEREIGDLLNRLPHPDPDFVRGSDAAAKIYFTAPGRLGPRDDPDYVAAKERLTSTGVLTEDTSIAAEMLRVMYFEYVMDTFHGERGAS
jgi:hypothetical protein